MKTKYIVTIQVLASLLCISSAAVYADVYNTAEADSNYVATVDGTGYTDLQEAFDQAVADDKSSPGRTVHLEILKDVSLTEWTSVSFNSYGGDQPNQIYVDGKDHVITGLTNPLFKKTWTGDVLSISNLTIDNARMEMEFTDDTGFAALIAVTEATKSVVLENCRVTSSSIVGGDWNGALIGWAAGYSDPKDGPVFTVVDITDCVVSGNTLIGGGSTGSLIGHATANQWTQVNVSETYVIGNTITGGQADGGRTDKTGIVFGTTGWGQTYLEKDGGVNISGIVSYGNNNTLNSNIFGRIGQTGGTINVYGGDFRDAQFVVSDPGTSTNIKVYGGAFKNSPEYIAEEKSVVDIGSGRYAVGSNSDVFKVTFDMNGHGQQVAEQTVKFNTKAEAPQTPVESGFVFDGWYLDPDFSISWDFGTDVVITATKLYAKWSVYETVTVTFHANDGTGTTTTQTITAGTETALDPNTFAREGYTFVNWNTESDGSGTSYADKAAVTLTDDIDLYAQWDTLAVKISFNANGGTGSMPDQNTFTMTPTELRANGFTREGYTFAYWSTTAAGTGYTYADKATVILTGDITLYAIWSVTPVAVYTVTFDSDEGSYVQPISVISGNVAEKPANPTKENSKFAGWYTDDGRRYAFTEPVTKDITLYAAWVYTIIVSAPESDLFSVTFIDNETQEVDIGSTLTFTVDAADGYSVSAVYSNDEKINAEGGVYSVTAGTVNIQISVIVKKTGTSVETETIQTTTENDDGSVTETKTVVENNDDTKAVSLKEDQTTSDGKTTTTNKAEASVSGSSIAIDISATGSDSATVTSTIAGSIDEYTDVEGKTVSVTTPKKTVIIEKDAWDILGETSVTVTVNNKADFQAQITVSKDSFGTQSSLALGVAESSKVVPSDIGKTTKAFDLTATMGGNAVSTFEKNVKVVMTFDSIPSNASKVYAYCIDNGDRIEATFNSQTGEVSFETPHFSSWTIVYEEPSSSGSNTLAIAIAVVLVGCLALAAVAVLFRRKNAA